MNLPKKIGAHYLGNNQTEFMVYAPQAKKTRLHLLNSPDQYIALTPQEYGYYQVITPTQPGAYYRICLDEQEFPDPASRFQPQGVFGPSQVIADDYVWHDQNWQGLPFSHYLIYECHVGTFTHAGTFTQIIAQLDRLCNLGITALELMPIAQFSGQRNWGYDGVFPFAPQNSYGHPDELKQLIDACHQRGLAVILDVVYNHLGPEGNVLEHFGPYFTDKHKTPWGSAINFDGAGSDAVRNFFLANAMMWLQDYHIDALRIDAAHIIYDYSAYHFLAELSDIVHRLAEQQKRPIYLIAESALNDTRLIRAHERGGYELDAQWNDDFQHALHALLTGEKNGYYQDFGSIDQLTKAVREGFVLTGQYSHYWQCRHGASSEALTPERFVVFSQNHDHAGNRVQGERLTQLLSFEQLKLTAGIALLSPFVPLLFMGEEYAETAPFLYFTDHTDPKLASAVWEGRKIDMRNLFGNGNTPDPQAESAFLRSKLNPDLTNQLPHQTLYRFYQALIQLRKSQPALFNLNKDHYQVQSDPNRLLLFLHRWLENNEIFIIFNFSSTKNQIVNPLPSGKWQKILSSAAESWQGPGDNSPQQIGIDETILLKLEPHSVVVFQSQVSLRQDS